jgi:hypothetical protein
MEVIGKVKVINPTQEVSILIKYRVGKLKLIFNQKIKPNYFFSSVFFVYL